MGSHQKVSIILKGNRKENGHQAEKFHPYADVGIGNFAQLSLFGRTISKSSDNYSGTRYIYICIGMSLNAN